MSGVKASSPLEPIAFTQRCRELAPERGFRVEEFGSVAGCPLLALTRRAPGPRPRIYLSAGIHGDEPAPPFALLDLLERGTFDGRATWLLAPLLNPAGFLRGTRENASAIDLNRDYRSLVTAEVQAHVRWLETQPPFDLALCLHEDWEATGFYLYELNGRPGAGLADAMVAAVLPHLPIDPAAMIDGRSVAEPGIIRPDADPRLREQWPEAIYLRAHHTPLCYTLETPSSFPLTQRVGAMAAVIAAALDRYCRTWTRP